MKKSLKFIFLFIFVVTLSACLNLSESDSNNNGNNAKNTIPIENIFSTSSNYAIVKGNNNKIYVIDKDNHTSGIIENSNYLIFQVNDNGYVYAFSNGISEIFDKEGISLYKSNDDVKYIYGISSDNYIIRKNKDKYEVINMNGNIVYSNLPFETDPVYVGGNYFITNNILFNIKSGKSKEFNLNIDVEKYVVNEHSDYIKKYKEIDDDIVVLDNKYLIMKNLSIRLFDFNKCIPINELCYLNIDDNKIYTYDNYPLRKIEINKQIKAFYSNNDRYYVGTEDGYYYVFDKSFNEVITPIKLGSKIRVINEYGIFANKDTASRKTSLYDFQGELKKDFNDYYLYDVQDFLAKSFIDGVSNDTPIININTFNEFIVYR